MSIVAQYGTIRWHESLLTRQWENTGNEHIPIVFFETNKVPAFQFMVDTSGSATYTLIDENGTEIVAAKSITVEIASGYKRFLFLGETLAGGEVQENGYYAIKVTSLGVSYYSDVFAWTDDTDKLQSDTLKVTATGSDFYIGYNNDYLFKMTGFTLECYLNVKEYRGITPAVEEKGNDENGVIRPYYTSMSKSREWIIYGNQYIYEFLLALRIIDINGTVTVNYRGDSYDANDSMVDIEERFNGFDILDLLFSIRPSADVITVKNNFD